MDVMNVTFAYVVQALAVVIVLYEVFKKVMENDIISRFSVEKRLKK